MDGDSVSWIAELVRPEDDDDVDFKTLNALIRLNQIAAIIYNNPVENLKSLCRKLIFNHIKQPSPLYLIVSVWNSQSIQWKIRVERR